MSLHVFEFVLLILVIVFAYKAFETFLKSRSNKQAEATEEETDQKLKELEERVNVLERIVTDERYDLRKQFKDLES